MRCGQCEVLRLELLEEAGAAVRLNGAVEGEVPSTGSIGEMMCLYHSASGDDDDDGGDPRMFGEGGLVIGRVSGDVMLVSSPLTTVMKASKAWCIARRSKSSFPR